MVDNSSTEPHTPLHHSAGTATNGHAPETPLLQAALDYARRQWPVVPLHDLAAGYCSCVMGRHCPSPGKHPRIKEWQKQASIDTAQIRLWWKQWPHANVGSLTGGRSRRVVVDTDPRNGSDVSLAHLERTYGPLPETVTGLTGGGGAHLHYANPDGVDYIPSCTGHGALLPGIEIKADGGHQVAMPPSRHASGNAYEWEVTSGPDDVPLAPLPAWLLTMIQTHASRQHSAAGQDSTGPLVEGLRNATLFRLGCSMRARGFSQGAILAALTETNAERCTPPLTDAEVQTIAKSCTRYEPGTAPPEEDDGQGHISAAEAAGFPQEVPKKEAPPAQGDPFYAKEGGLFTQPHSRAVTGDDPLNALNALNTQSRFPKMAEAAYYGIAGDFVRTVAPHSEADPVALLMQFLVAFGVAVGTRPYFQVEATWHRMNLFAVLVGESSKARKGTAAGHVHALYETIDEAFAANGVTSGLSSGEGLIWAVRDQIVKRVRKKEHNEVKYIDVVEDPGVLDKRQLLVESEFAQPLKVMRREGNILSTIIRQAWDTGNLRVLTKNSPARSTGAHIGILGHITREELLRHLTDTESGNGFGNRILWLCVKRSKALPEGGLLTDTALKPLVTALRSTLTVAKTLGRLQRDDDARALWKDRYTELSAERPGLLGAITARAEAQALRLSCVYALLDQTATIRRPHLEAALAVWDYADASAKYLFGATLGDPLADEILGMLRLTPHGMTRTDLYNALGRHRKSGEIGAALVRLHQKHLAYHTTEPTNGRAVERWVATTLPTPGGEKTCTQSA
jgi:hypothetical protein